MENLKWKMESSKWKMESGKWKVVISLLHRRLVTILR